MTPSNSSLRGGRADARAARRARAAQGAVHLPLHRQGRQEVLRPDDSADVPRPAARADQQAGPGGEAHRSTKATRRRASRRKPNAEKKRELDAAQRDAMRRNRALLATYTSEKDIEDARARDAARAPEAGAGSRRRASTRSRSARRASRRSSSSIRRPARATPPARLKEEITNAEIDLKAQQDAARREEEGRGEHQRALRRRPQALPAATAGNASRQVGC